jgi:hypothetical protein
MPDTDRPVAPDRTFTAARRAQGFRSAEHLAAFFAHFDHVRSCPDCGGVGPALLLDDGAQSTVRECPIGVRLYVASQSERF